MRKALLAAAFLLSGCGLLTAEIDVERVDVTVPNNTFSSNAAATQSDWCDPSAYVPGPAPCVAASLDYDLGSYVPALTDNSVTYDLRLLDVAVTLSATQPPPLSATDLSGIVSASVRVLDPPPPANWDGISGYGSWNGQGQPPGTVVASYTRPDPIPAPFPESISVAGDAGLDLGPYLDTGRLPIRVEVVLDNTMPSFNADVHAGFSLMMKVDWGSYL